MYVIARTMVGTTRFSLFWVVCFSALLVSSQAYTQAVGGATLSTPAVRSLSFEENRGQAPEAYSHLLRSPGYTAGFAPDSLVVALSPAEASAPAPLLRFSWSDAQPAVPQGEDPATERIHYLKHDASPDEPGSAVPVWTRLRYRSVYPGIDLVYYMNGDHLEFDLEIAAQADRSAPVLRIDGADSLELDASGNLVIAMNGQRVLQRAPHSFQVTGGQRHTVLSRYRILDAHHVAIDLGRHDAALPLTVDPILDFATYLGGSGTDTFSASGTDAAGNVYVLGRRSSPRLPADGGTISPVTGTFGVLFVSRLSPDLSQVQRTTYLDVPTGYLDEYPRMAVAPDGQVYIVYRAKGSISAFGSTAGPHIFPATAISNDLERIAILALTPDGNALRFRTLVGCEGSLYTAQMHAAADGLTFAATALCPSFPVSPGAFTNNPPHQPFVYQILLARISPDGQQLPFSTRFGGNGGHQVGQLWRDATGRIWLSGLTNSSDFPTTSGAYRTVRSTEIDGFLLRFNPDGSALEVSTLLPGRVARFTHTVDGFVHALLAQPHPDFQATPQAFRADRGQSAPVLLRMDDELESIVWSTFYLDHAGVIDLAVNADGETLLLSQAPSNLPLTQSALLRRGMYGVQQYHLGRVGAGGTVLRDSTYFFSPHNMGAGRILSFSDGASTLVSGPHESPFAPPATTAANLTVDQPGKPFGIYFSRILWDHPTVCSVTLSPPVQSVSAEGGDARVNVDAPPGCPWVLWHPYSSLPGFQLLNNAGIGPGEVTIRYPRWDSADSDRTLYYQVDDQEVQVVQSRASCDRRSITPSSVDIDTSGGLLSLDFDIPNGCEWVWTPPAAWAVLTSDGSNPLPQYYSRPVPVRLEVHPNSFEARETSFTIAGLVVPVRQAAGTCTATVSPLVVDLPVSGGTATINLATSAPNCAWQALPSADLSIVGSPSGTGSGTFQVSLPANPSNVPLVATVHVAGKIVQVRQPAGECQATVSPLSFQTGASPSTQTLSIHATGSACSWRAASSEAWVQLRPQTAPSGSGQLDLIVKENDTGHTRTAAVSVLGHTVNITQLGEAVGRIRVGVPEDEPFTLNGVAYHGPQDISLPLGSSYTIAAQARRQPAPGVLVLNTGWNGIPSLALTFTVSNETAMIQLDGTRLFRVQVGQTGSVPGDQSTVSLQVQPGTWRDEPDGRYVHSGGNAVVTATPGSLSRFARWEGAPSSFTHSREFLLWVIEPYSLTAVFEPASAPSPLQFSPPRLTLRYGSTQDLLTAVATITSTTPSPVTTTQIGCTGLSVPPLSSGVLAANTPTAAEVNLQVHWVALLDPGEYACEVVFGIPGYAASNITIPVDLTVVEQQVPASAVRVAAIVEAAGFRRLFPSPGSIASIFGERLAPGEFHATTLPLPESLGEVRVELVNQQSGISAFAPLFFVSPQQINYLVPAGFPTGTTELRVHRPGFFTGTFPSFVQSHQPSLFSANSNGMGAPAGEFVRVHELTGERVNGDLAVCAEEAGICTPRHLEFGSDDETLFLILYGTGFTGDNGMAVVSVDGLSLPVEYTGPHSVFAGLDQINVRIPRTLAGRGIITLNVTYAGLPANYLQVEF